jgi:hypothetical protein
MFHDLLHGIFPEMSLDSLFMVSKKQTRRRRKTDVLMPQSKLHIALQKLLFPTKSPSEAYKKKHRTVFVDNSS